MRPNSQYSPFIAALVMCFVALLLAPAQVSADSVGWFDDEAAVDISGAPSIRISLGEQRAYFYMGGELVGISRISSGRAGYRTPKGSYRVRGKKLRHRSTLYGSYVDRNTHRVVRADVDTRKHRRPPGTYYRGAKMDYFIRFNGGIGLHASGDVPNYPASHGCVRMPRHMAQKFFRYARVGTPVIVTD
ncbi:L,D-transpeptidase [Microbulbifer marinus]|uniref:L,D-transpeptidase catalytic domain n=1 Tax=Microbulbifer marinus TaxID=658218 RepID=A0A1H4BEG5_9GAMM|nr:L,D-transpeptidase [Microbulbifer marinus]SEA46378.1 L,D-transpeptidase catalytic domain [Microbulbifer marinus]